MSRNNLLRDIGLTAVIAVLLFILLTLSSESNAADEPEPWIDEIDIPERFLSRGDRNYFTHRDSCINDDEVMDWIEEIDKELDVYGVPLSWSGNHSDFDKDGLNTIGCAEDNPFSNALIVLEEGLSWIEQPLTVQDVNGNLFTYGVTRSVFYTDTGEIIEWDIWLSRLWMLVEDIAKRVIRHEFGHVFGLDHSEEFEDGLMNANGGDGRWDAETIARIDINYDKCTALNDEYFHLWIPKLWYDNKYWYGIMPEGGKWPYDLMKIAPSHCR